MAMNQTRSISPIGWSYRSWRIFFLVSALWNLSGSLPALAFPELNLELFYGITGADYYMVFLNRALWWAVLIFGIGYLIIAHDPGKNLGIVIMGIIGKTVIAVHWFYLYGIGRAEIFPVIAGAGDSTFTVFFVIYLWRGPRSP